MKPTAIRIAFAMLAVFALMAVYANAQQDFSNVQIKANKISNNFYTLDGQGGTIGLLVRAIRRKKRSAEQVRITLRELPHKSTLHISRPLLEQVIAQLPA